MTEAIERIKLKVEIDRTTGCWNWRFRTNQWGYGQIRFKGVWQDAYRLAYISKYGEPDKTLELDHLCNNPLCANPDHLEPVTHQENMRRAWNRRTICRNKLHEMTPDNIRLLPGGKRACKKCLEANFKRKRRLEE